MPTSTPATPTTTPAIPIPEPTRSVANIVVIVGRASDGAPSDGAAARQRREPRSTSLVVACRLGAVNDDLIEIAKTAIGAEVGLSAAQARRLSGGSADELRRDARAMAAELGLI
jgi:hypothetical protein